MKKVWFILLATVILIGLALNDVKAQSATKLEGECYLAIINDSGLAWDQVRLNGEQVGKLDNNAAFLKNFQCGDEKAMVELQNGSNILKKELTVIKGPSAHQNPMNKFIWKLD